MDALEQPAQNDRDRRTFFLGAILILIIALLALALYMAHKGKVFVQLNTKLAKPDLMSVFPQVSIGDPIRQTYEVLGPPLYFTVNPDMAGNGSYRQYADYDVKLNHLLDVLADPKKRVSLLYSAPRHRGLNHYLYFVRATNGIVDMVGGPIEID